MAEKAVQTIKNVLRKVTEDKKDFYLALLDLRNTPISDDTGSPVQRLMGRRTKTLLPTTEHLLIPKQIKPQAVKRKIKAQKDKQKYYYDRQAKELPTLEVGDRVRTQRNSHWEPAIVTGVSTKPRSYIITTPQGEIYRRNRKHLSPQKLDERRKISLSPQDKAEDDVIDPHDSPTNQSFQAEEGRNTTLANQVNRNDRLQKTHKECNTDHQSPEGGDQKQNLRRSTRIKRRPDYYSESQSESSNIRKGEM